MTTTKLLVLGCINRRNVAHGYEVYRDLLDWRADRVIDMGPEAGSKGGEVLFEGLVRDLKTRERSMTAKFI